MPTNDTNRLRSDAAVSLNVFEEAQKQWPILRNPDILYKRTPREGGDKLEAFPPDEPGSPERPRPQEFPSNKYGIEVYSDQTRPIDVLGDVVSHFLINTDPRIADLTSHQEDRLRSQYKWYKDRGENRSYDDWRKTSGLPAYFRGYPFQQWKNSRSWYTHQQLQLLDDMMRYLSMAR